jgi:hypothetical protein
VRSRIIDVSEGGLCLISPIWLKPKQKMDIAINVPGTGLSKVRVEIWHIRRFKAKKSNSRVWMAGAILVDADEAYAKLLSAAGVAPLKIEIQTPTGAEPSAPKPPGKPNGRKAPPRPAATRPPFKASKPAPPPTSPATPPSDPDAESIDSLEPTIYRIRCKAKVGPRSRVLTLAAESETDARSFATRDLGDSWTVLEIRRA